LCWCRQENGTFCAGNTSTSSAVCASTASGNLCDRPTHFDIDIGQLVIVGPSEPVERTCVSGQRCMISGTHGTGWSVSLHSSCARQCHREFNGDHQHADARAALSAGWTDC
jgi:hypothetical protein